MESAVRQWQLRIFMGIPYLAAFFFTVLWLCNATFLKIFPDSAWRYIAVISLSLTLGLLINFKYSNVLKRYLNHLLQLKLLAWLTWFIVAIFFTHIFSSPLLRRFVWIFYGGSVVLMIIPELYSVMSDKNYYEKIFIILLSLFLTIFAIPGFYAPPFTSTISGWTNIVNPAAPIRVVGLQLVRDDGAAIWFTNNIVDPNNFIFRQISHLGNQGRGTLGELFDYYFKVYKQRYHLLKQGLEPTQRIFSLGFPQDDPDKILNYKAFPPNKIKALRMVDRYYDPKTKKLQKKFTYYTYNVRTHKFLKG